MNIEINKMLNIPKYKLFYINGYILLYQLLNNNDTLLPCLNIPVHKNIMIIILLVLSMKNHIILLDHN